MSDVMITSAMPAKLQKSMSILINGKKMDLKIIATKKCVQIRPPETTICDNDICISSVISPSDPSIASDQPFPAYADVATTYINTCVVDNPGGSRSSSPHSYDGKYGQITASPTPQSHAPESPSVGSLPTIVAPRMHDSNTNSRFRPHSFGTKLHMVDYPCKICGAIFQSFTDVKDHESSCRGKSLLFKCANCEEIFNEVRSFEVHKRLCLAWSVNCGFGSPRAFKTVAHFVCRQCGWLFDDKTKLEQHETKHEYPDKKNCSFCDKLCLTRAELIRHERDHTNSAATKNCPHCSKGFKTNAQLRVHETSHSGEKKFKCSYCDKRFAVKENLVQHTRSHTGEKPYVCSICSKAFSRPSNYNVHLKLHQTGKRFFCFKCPKWFRSEELLVRHEKVCGKDDSQMPHHCSYCGKGYKNRRAKLVHERCHTGMRPFLCGYCNKSFTQSNALTVHIRLHTGEKPYKCRFCHKTFTDSSACRKHEFIGHPLQCNLAFDSPLRRNTDDDQPACSAPGVMALVNAITEQSNLAGDGQNHVGQANQCFESRRTSVGPTSNSYAHRRRAERNDMEEDGSLSSVGSSTKMQPPLEPTPPAADMTKNADCHGQSVENLVMSSFCDIVPDTISCGSVGNGFQGDSNVLFSAGASSSRSCIGSAASGRLDVISTPTPSGLILIDGLMGGSLTPVVPSGYDSFNSGFSSESSFDIVDNPHSFHSNHTPHHQLGHDVTLGHHMSSVGGCGMSGPASNNNLMVMPMLSGEGTGMGFGPGSLDGSLLGPDDGEVDVNQGVIGDDSSDVFSIS